ncbi:MAG: methyltransferase domain-containing protein [Victivallales bacterium]
MKRSNFNLDDVQKVYDGPGGKLWELVMGEQIHVGGWKSSNQLAGRAGIKKGMKVIDLCSALGAGLRFLVVNYDVTGFGLDGTRHMVDEARKRVEADGLSGKIDMKLGDVTDIPWPDETFDVVWGEDAWCYVVDKNKLIKEALRVLRPGGKIAFTDWIEAAGGLADEEAERINAFMKFPYMESRKGYEAILKEAGFEIEISEDLTADFADHIELYIKMLAEQLTFDALRIIGNDLNLFQAMGKEMAFMLEMARRNKFGRCRVIALKQ